MSHVVVGTMLNSISIMTYLYIFIEGFGKETLLFLHHMILFQLCRRNLEDVFFSKICVGGKRCPEYGNLTFFHRNFPRDPSLPRLLYIMVTWRKYEYVTTNPSSSLVVYYKRVVLLDYDIIVS